MKRREFIKLLCAAGVSAPFAPSWLRAAEAASAPYNGDLLIFINAQGGWDPVQFCDPKGNLRNTFGEADIVSAGKIRYAPLSSEGHPYAVDFFDRFYQRMVVVQGVNMQTNAHSAGVTNAFQGSFATGFPTLSAAFAAVHAPAQSMAYMVTGGYRATGGLLPYTAINDASLIQDLSLPNRTERDLRNNLNGHRMPPEVLEKVFEAQRLRRQRLLEDTQAMPRWREMLRYFDGAVEGTDAVEALGNILPPGGFQSVDERGIENELVKQADVFLHAMAAGLTAAVDAEFPDQPFDTHADHDRLQARTLAELVYGIRFIWDRVADLEGRLNISLSNRIVIVIVSDFGRTPSINSDGGTDHWPTTSAIIMREAFANNSIGNRNVGYSDSAYGSGRIDPVTLAPEPGAGIEITSAHLHKALRAHLGLAGASPLDKVSFPETLAEVRIFSPGIDTPQDVEEA